MSDLLMLSPADVGRVKAFLAQPRAARPSNEAPLVKIDGTVATIRIYQDIDDWGEFWGMSATELVTELDKLPSNVTDIDLRLNCRGGIVFEAITMVNALRTHPAQVTATVEGVAASAASFLAASADETVMMPNSRMMIHAVHGVAIGTSTDLRDTADHFDALTEEIASIYHAKTGTPVADWLAIMADGDTWYSAQEAVEAGLADRVGNSNEDNKIADRQAASADLGPGAAETDTPDGQLAAAIAHADRERLHAIGDAARSR